MSDKKSDYKKRLAEIEADYDHDCRARVSNVRTHTQRGWLLAWLRDASNALAAAGIADDGRPLAERIGGAFEAAHVALDPIVARRDTADGPPLSLATRAATAVRIAQEAVAARDAAIALGYNDGRTVGEQAESICLLADVLRGKSITVEHRCADPAKCPLCLAVAETDPAPQTREDENPEQERERHLRSMRDALAFFEEWAEAEDYGAFPGGDPRFFTPDPDASTDEERAAHKSACEAWERGDRIAFDVGPLNSTELRVKGRVVPPGTALVNCQVFGLGTVVRRDAEMMRVRDGLRAALASIQGPVDSGFDVEEPARRGVEQAEGDGSDPGSEGAHAGSIAAGAPSRKGNRHDPLAGLTEEQRQHLTSLASDPAFRARFNGSRARIAVLNEPVPLERRGAARMREYLNGAFDLTITAADLATALGISEADMLAIEVGTKTTDDAGWTEIQTALFMLGSGTKPEHIAGPASSPAFQRAMEREEEPTCPGPDCPMCNGEACALCGAGTRSRLGEPPCEHDVAQRHTEPTKDDAPEETDPAGHGPEAMWSDLAGALPPPEPGLGLTGGDDAVVHLTVTTLDEWKEPLP